MILTLLYCLAFQSGLPLDVSQSDVAESQVPYLQSINQSFVLSDVSLTTGELLHFELTRFRVFKPDAVIEIHTEDGVELQSAPEHYYYKGAALNAPETKMFIVFRQSGDINGIIHSPGRMWIIGNDLEEGISEAQVEEVPFENPDQPWACSSDQIVNPNMLEQIVVDRNNFEQVLNRGTGHYEVTVAAETDFEYYQMFGNTTDATNYISDLIGFASTVYDAEINTQMMVGSVSLWTTAADPWDESGTLCSLFEFGKYWNDNNGGVSRTTAHFFSGRNMGGGIAWVGVLCSSGFTYDTTGSGCSFSGNGNYGGAYGFSASLTGGFNINSPASVWDIIVISHEIGHNYNSPHTHCYNGIGGNALPIDQCYNLQAGCYAGPTSLPCALPPGNGCATIMSYCHLLAGSYNNIALTLGLGHPHGVAPERVPERMAAHVVSTNSGNSACLPFVNDCTSPSISQHPQSASGCPGSTVTLSVTATGDNLSYQWRKNSSNLSGQTSSSLTLSGITGGDAGSYDCVVTNSCGSVTSNSATVSIANETYSTSLLPFWTGQGPNMDCQDYNQNGILDIVDYVFMIGN